MRINENKEKDLLSWKAKFMKGKFTNQVSVKREDSNHFVDNISQ